MKRVVLVGAGITGLTTALHLKDRAAELEDGLEVVVLEGRDRTGGNILTERVDGFTIETGPNGFLDNVPAMLRLVDRLGLADRLQRANESVANRFLYRHGRLHPLPTGPASFLTSRVFSLRGRLRVLAEPFATPKPRGVDETVHDFAARRIGPEAAAVLVDAMVSGIFAGNVRELSLRSSFPKMWAMEEEHGGLVRAMIAGTKRPRGTLTSFDEGLGLLIRRLEEEVGHSVRRGAPVAAIRRGENARSWDVALEGGERIPADAVVVAVPSPKGQPILETVDPTLASTVGEIPTAGLAVVAFGFRREDLLGVDLDGFGFLVPRGTGPRILGCLWESSLFPGRAPERRVLLRCMIGGAHDPEAVMAPDDSLMRQVRADLESTMGIPATVEPVLTRVYRWPIGIGQYTVGHQERLDRIRARLERSPGLWVAGSSFYGVSMNACVENAAWRAEDIIGFLCRKAAAAATTPPSPSPLSGSRSAALPPPG